VNHFRQVYGDHYETKTRSWMSFVITTTLLLGSSAFGQEKSDVEKDLRDKKTSTR